MLLVAIRRRIPQDGVVLRWCGERGWKLRGSTGLASSILVAVASFCTQCSCDALALICIGTSEQRTKLPFCEIIKRGWYSTPRG